MLKLPSPKMRLCAYALLLLGLLNSNPLAATTFAATTEIDQELRTLLLNAVKSSDSFTDRYDAEAWLMLQSNKLNRFVKEPEKRLTILRAVHSEATRAGLQPELVLAVIEIESAFDRYAVSRVGAQGMMQVMPFWKLEIGRAEDNLIDMHTNLRYGCTILKHYINRSDGHWADALARYNGSYGKYWYSEKVLNAWQRWR